MNGFCVKMFFCVIFYKHILKSPSLSNIGMLALPHLVKVAFLVQRVKIQHELTALFLVKKKYLRLLKLEDC